ncbi:lysophospholipid acyltransferase family protein [Myxococcota bacterium]|nr:lysophospholipid acyltransferase family protein [Myxococcota bacterium]
MRKWFGKMLLKLVGWKAEGTLPGKKVILITAPHTTNWDFFYMILMAMYFDIQISWMGKHTLFRFPYGWFMRWMGGIPIDRRANHNIVTATAEQFKKTDALILGIPAEGTRKYVDYWKSGFYFIAKEAHVPIVLGFLDYEKKIGGFGPSLIPSDDLRADMDKIRAFYKDIKGKYPEKFGRIRLRAEDETETKSQ